MNPFTVEIYHLDVGNSLLEKLDEIEGYSGLEFNKILNDAGQCVLTMDVRHKKATSDNLKRWANHINIKKHGRSVWFGPITKLHAGLGPVVASSLVIEARQHAVHLKNRFTDALVNYINTDAGDIAWQLINTVQSRPNGELMIRQGTIQTTMNRDRTYEYGNIFELIQNLTEVIGGFDFEITIQEDADKLVEQLNFNVYQNKGTYQTSLPTIQLGVNALTVDAVTSSPMINDVILLGAGTDTETINSSDSDSNLQLYSTRREAVEKEPDVSVQATLDQKVDQILNANKVELWNVQFTLESLPELSFGTFDTGDILKVDLVRLNDFGEPTLINFKGNARIREINVQVDENGGEIVIPTISTIN